jgi:predicted metal-binding membrane protein
MTSWLDTSVGARTGCGTHLLLVGLILLGWAFALAQLLTIDTPGSLAEAGPGMQIFAFIKAYVFGNPFAYESALSFSASATGAWGVTDMLKSAAIWLGMILAMMLPVLLPLNRTASRNPPPPSATFEGARFPRQEFRSWG